MAVGFPTKVDYATGDVLSATNMNDLSGTVNLLESAQYAAGKNKIINGDFGINQRAFTSTTTSGTYGFDRWFVGAADGTVTYSSQTFTPGTAPVAGYEGTNFAQLVTSGQTLTTAQGQLVQRIESARTFAGQTITFSFWAKANTGTPNINPQIRQNFGSGGSPSAEVTTNGTVQTITTSWARYSFTIAIPSVSGKTFGTTATSDYFQASIFVSNGSAGSNPTVGVQNNTFQIWGVQVEAASTASAFQTATGTKQGELAACQRYYYRTSVATGDRMAVGFNNTTTVAELVLNLPVTMRIAATALEQSGTATDYSIRGAAGNTACSAVPTFTIANPNYGVFQLTVASGLTIGQASLYRANSANGYLGWSAEL